MTRPTIMFLFLLQLAHADAGNDTDTSSGADWWKDCPGKACPARVYDSETFPSMKSKKDKEVYEQMDNKQIRKEKEAHEYELKAIQREELRRGIDR